MSAKDIERAGAIGKLISRFPEEWLTYQDWLRDITASYPALQARYRDWQATLIFRWRLLYFVIYVGSIIVIHQLQRFLPRRKTTAQPLDLDQDKNPFTSQYFFVLQRLATLLAVAELTLCGVAAFTGIMLAFYYEPSAMGAHQSLVAIATQISCGTLILSLHNIAGNGLIVLALIQIVVMYLGRQFLLPWFTAWISGLLLTVSAIGLSWTAVVLNWDQAGFWRFKIEMGTIASIPLVGPGLRAFLTGGAGISSLTLQHMYALHSYVLAIAAILLSITHLTALLYQEQAWKSEGSWLKRCSTSAQNESSPL
ncbi:Cytochrome bc complex cytochrome b subunit [Acaryochloris thomasi RCC1774]|uniref:Cytochrome bc complex cytochrome b subunit n=1 Tax=Acaryochloris thomasi RCC1774 TaxID=1764569 RepID=A0A2W1JTT9_9CYAN|nr:cytochrome b N-terminal domain-containing protein [Acaryochloris thomasi]PZD73244.1 Cytochrome bc complex cytochrome b subunit [Acaryochloris thomasi RCC1774]